MNTARIAIGISAEEMIGSLRALHEAFVRMRRRYGPLRYLMPRWWRLRKQLKQLDVKDTAERLDGVRRCNDE